MLAVLRVDAAPGFEDSVEAQLRYTQGVKSVLFHKDGNFDFVVLVDVKDAAELQSMMHNKFRTLSGLRSTEKLSDPSPELRKKLGL